VPAESYDPVVALLASESAAERVVAAKLLYFAGAPRLAILEDALARERDRAVRAVLRDVVDRLR
jgi:hypothetical protein